MPSASVPPAADVLPRQQVRDPDLWLDALACLVIVLSILQVLLFAFGRDQGIYAVVAEGILHGKMPYRDIWDFKPPGIYFVFAAAQALFGKIMLAPRLLEGMGLVLMVLGFVRLADTFFDARIVGAVGGAVAVLTHAQLEFWHTSQPEAFGGFLTVGALVLATSRFRRRQRWAVWALVGFSFGCAFLLKPPLGGGALVCAAYLARSEITRTGQPLSGAFPVLVAGASSLVPIALCLWWFCARDSWQALIWTLGEFTPGYTALAWRGQSAPEMFYVAFEEAFFRFSALLAAGFIAAIVMRPLHSREREGILLILGVVSVHLAGIAMQGKFFAYHYSATLPLIALIAGLGLYKLWRRCLLGGASGVLAFASFVVVAVLMREPVRDLPQTFWERSALRLEHLMRPASPQERESLDEQLAYVADYKLSADREVAREIAQRVPPGEPVFVWGFEPVIYWLSEREPASRFIYNVPQRAPWERKHARAELTRDLKQNQPAMIVVQRNDVFPAVTGSLSDSRQSLLRYPALKSLLEQDYQLARRIEDFELYAREPLTPSEASRAAGRP